MQLTSLSKRTPKGSCSQSKASQPCLPSNRCFGCSGAKGHANCFFLPMISVGRANSTNAVAA
jgi:hypothetical protein